MTQPDAVLWLCLIGAVGCAALAWLMPDAVAP
jgi:hypothetical protein